jgi:hypothetical protein
MRIVSGDKVDQIHVNDLRTSRSLGSGGTHSDSIVVELSDTGTGMIVPGESGKHVQY